MATTQSSNIDWEMPEYQNALKMVIKYEIQSLLERLSETGEETVLLTANTTDLCVGHLASERGKRFLSTTEVGEMKNKFLYFCTVEGAGGGTNETGIKVTVLPQKNASPPGRGRGRGGRGRPRGSTTGSGRGNKQAAAQFQAAKPVVGPQGQGPLTGHQGQGDISHRLVMSQHSAGQKDYGALSDTEMATKFSNVKAQSSVKSGQKRQQQFTAEEIQNMIVSAETKRRKVDLEKQTLSPQGQKMTSNQPDKNKSTVQKVDNLPQNKHQFLVSDDDSNDYYEKQAHHDPRLSHNDSKIGVKGAPFSQENSEFHKFLEQYNAEVSKKFAGEDSEYEDEYDEEDELEEYELMENKLEKGEIPQSEQFDGRAVSAQGQMLPHTSQSHFTPSQFQRQFQNFQKNNQNTVYQTLPAAKNQAKSGTNEFDPHIEIKEEVETEGYGDNVLAPVTAKSEKDPKAKDKEPQISLQTIISKATKKLTEPGQNKQPSSSNEAQGIPEIKEEADPHDLDYKQSADSSTSGLKQQADSSNQRVDTSPRDSEIQQPDTTQHTKGPQTSNISPGPGSRAAASGEKSKSQDMAEADVSAKLKMLSAKLSWVVEFPKNFEQGQQKQQPSNYPPVEEHEYPEDYEENEEEEEYDEDELDEDELAAMRQYQEAQRRHQNVPPGLQQHGQGQQQFQQRLGHVGEEYDEEDDYDEEEMEHLGDEEEEEYGEYGEVDSEDERALRELGILDAQGGVHGHLHHGNMKLPPPGGTLKPGQQGQIHKEIFNQRALETDIGKHLFPKASSEMDNFILMGAMAKCLVCNKLVRKSDMVQHNIIHAQEEEGDEEELDEMHEEFDEMGEEMDEMHGEMGEMHGEMGEMHGEMCEMPDEMGEMHEEGENDEEMLGEDHEGMQELSEDLQESHGDDLKGMGNEMHGEMQEMIGTDGEVNPEELGEESYGPELTAEKVTAEKIDQDDKTCYICNKPFRNKSSLIKHLKTHDPKDLKCELCQRTFRLQSYLEKHQKKMHPNAVFHQQETDKRETLDCALCKMTFQSKQEIEQHMMSSHA